LHFTYTLHFRAEVLSSFFKAIKNLGNLTTFELFMMGRPMNNQGIKYLLHRIKELKFLSKLTLDLKTFGGEELRYTLLKSKNNQSCSSLFMNFDSSYRIWNEDIKNISSRFGIILSLKQLKLSFKSCQNVTDEGIKYLAVGLATLTSLESLELRFRQGPTIHKIGSLAHSFENLVNLQKLSVELMQCNNIESQGVEEFFSRFKHINFLTDLHIKFCGCELISDSALKLLSSNFTNFKWLKKLVLDFSNNPQISCSALESLISNLKKHPALRSVYLDFSNCNKISKNEKKRFLKDMRKFKSFDFKLVI